MASDVKPYVIFISPPSYDRILTLRRGKVDPFNPKPNNQMTVSFCLLMNDDSDPCNPNFSSSKGRRFVYDKETQRSSFFVIH